MRPPRMETLQRGWPLAAARSLVMGWTWLYTAALTAQVRGDRRAEIWSDVHEQIEDKRGEGDGQTGTAVRLLRRMASGVWDDMSWALPQIPSALAVHLVRGEDAIGQLKPSPWGISYLAVATLVNVFLALSDWKQFWPAWLIANAVVLGATLLLHRQREPWARGILLFAGSFTVPMGIGLGITAVWNPESVTFQHSLMLEAVLMVPLVILGLLVACRISGASVFNGSWWPLLLCIPCIGFGLWGSGIAVDGSPETLLEVSVATGVLCAAWAALSVGFAQGSKVGSYALFGGASITLRLLSKGMSQG